MATNASSEDLDVDVEISGGCDTIKITPQELRFSGRSGQGRLEVKIKHSDEKEERIKREAKEREKQEKEKTTNKIRELELENEALRRQRLKNMKDITSKLLSSLNIALQDESYDREFDEQYLKLLNEEHDTRKREAKSMEKQVSMQRAEIARLVEKYNKERQQKLMEVRQRQHRLILQLKTKNAVPVTLDKEQLTEVAKKLRSDFKVNLMGLDSNMDFILEFDQNVEREVKRQMRRIEETLALLLPPDSRCNAVWQQQQTNASRKVDTADMNLGQPLPRDLFEPFFDLRARGRNTDEDYVQKCANTGENIGRSIAGPLGEGPGHFAGHAYGLFTKAKSWFG